MHTSPIIPVYIETGKKYTIASAIEWPGWARRGKDQATALAALFEYGPRYGQALAGATLNFYPPASVATLVVIDWLDGNATTDFGAPAMVPTADRALVEAAGLPRLKTLLSACWAAFDQVAAQAAGKELRTGPRGGGRDLEKIMRHVLEADHAYLRKIAWKHKIEKGDAAVELERLRAATMEALDSAVEQGLPEEGPRGGVIWPLRYFVRRAAWHVLDHAWEIEDRVEG